MSGPVQMENATARVEGKKLVIEVDLAAQGVPSSSGKMLVFASSRGAVKIDGNGRQVSLSFNCCVPLSDTVGRKARPRAVA